MGKRRGSRKSSNLSHSSVSLREESTGRFQPKTSVGLKHKLRLEHLQKLAIWASKEPSNASLSGFFGHRLASIGESMGVTPDPSLFPCQRCEAILQPGFNCNVRIEKSRSKARHRCRKNVGIAQNNVLFRCHLCSHSNLLRGTPKGHMKEICPSNRQSSSKANLVPAILMEPCRLDGSIESKIEVSETDRWMPEVDEVPVTIFSTDCLGTPPVKQVTTLFDGIRRKRNRSANKAAEPIDAASDVEYLYRMSEEYLVIKFSF